MPRADALGGVEEQEKGELPAGGPTELQRWFCKTVKDRVEPYIL